MLPEGATWVLASADGKLTRDLPEGKTTLTYKDVHRALREPMAPTPTAFTCISWATSKEGVILTFYQHSSEQYWALEEVGSVRLYAGRRRPRPSRSWRSARAIRPTGAASTAARTSTACMFEAGATLTL